MRWDFQLGAMLIAVDAAMVGATMKLYCTYTAKDKLHPDHRLWAHVRLMERDLLFDDVLQEKEKLNRNRLPYMYFTLFSNDVGDGFGDDTLEVYLHIKHNCVRNVSITVACSVTTSWEST
ncbi:unnamed protein product [Strongylus vulgaris]|uniref:C2 tensin-type domain-containing protein n=1 Tax=Strongylus vulgaris TaxID=40348 RepID=A0A3P7JBB2_STRVU|nr:unnamed protein product [Strongylus vulgaris]